MINNLNNEKNNLDPNHSRSLPNLNEAINYLEQKTNKLPLDIKKIKITIKTIGLAKNEIKSFIKISNKGNYISVFSARHAKTHNHQNKKFSLIFNPLDKNTNTIKTLSHPVRNITVDDNLNKVLYISIRKKQDKIKLLKLTNHKIDDKKNAKNLNLNLKKGMLNDILCHNNKCLALVAEKKQVSIMEYDLNNSISNKNDAWNEKLKFDCSETIRQIKFSEQGSFIFALLNFDELAIYKKRTIQQDYIKYKTIFNIKNMPLDVSDEENLLCYDNEKLCVITCPR